MRHTPQGQGWENARERRGWEMRGAKEHSMLIKFYFLPVVLVAALAGCQSARHQEEAAPAPQSVTPGTTFSVTKDFLIPSGNGSVYFQDTRLYPLGEVQANYPYCQFDTGAATAAGQVIKGIFTVSNVEYDENGVGTGGTAVSITAIHLRHASSGESYRMNCMLPLLSRDARFVTPDEIQDAVDGYMDLKISP
jgi:hypothetical protein